MPCDPPTQLPVETPTHPSAGLIVPLWVSRVDKSLPKRGLEERRGGHPPFILSQGTVGWGIMERYRTWWTDPNRNAVGCGGGEFRDGQSGRLFVASLVVPQQTRKRHVSDSTGRRGRLTQFSVYIIPRISAPTLTSRKGRKWREKNREWSGQERSSSGVGDPPGQFLGICPGVNCMVWWGFKLAPLQHDSSVLGRRCAGKICLNNPSNISGELQSCFGSALCICYCW